MNAPDNPANDITLVMYLPEKGWTTFISIPRVKLGQICLAPVKWLRYIGSYAYGADGDIFSRVFPNANEDKMMADVPVDEAMMLSLVASLEELPAVCYFWSKYAPRVMDLRMTSDRKTTNASSNSDSGSFNREAWLAFLVKARDGDTCAFHASIPTHVSRALVQACHLIPQSKGDAYVEHLERFHEVPQEDQMNTVESSRNIVCMQLVWHIYMAKSWAAILHVPNRFLSKDDIAFTSQPRFADDGNSYSDLLRAEQEMQVESQSGPSATHPRFPSDEEFRHIEEKDITSGQQKAEGKGAEQARVHLTGGRGYPAFRKPPEQPFNDESQLVLQYFVTGGKDGVSSADERTVPHNTAARLREGTRLSVVALHTAYICAVWKAFCPDTENSVLAPDIPRFGHLTSLRAAPASGSHTATLSSTSIPLWNSYMSARREQKQRNDWAWDLMLGWRIPSVIARQEAEMGRARDVEREANEAKVRQWSRTVEQ
ncbi:hypothetical protein C8F01DRAFT_1122286 [Mycena amicta]|nr:hypothetical protein C8F01DRAFT_1122286 [Mycena amicta]